MEAEIAPRLEFRILGELEVAAGGETFEIAGRQQQALLALLLIHANEVVSPERLIDSLWGPSPPPTSAASLRVSVAKLRRGLEAAGVDDVLLTQPGGYVLRVEPDQLDIARFGTLVGEARRATGPAERRALLERALSIWRGPPAAGLEYDSVAQAELVRLRELRLLALEERIDCDLELGRHRELVPELEALVAAEPLRERRHAQLMRALNGSGRQADALKVYRRLRKRLVDELGLEPGAELRELEGSILRQDEEPSISDAAQMASPSSARRRRRWPVAAAAALAVAGATALVALLAFNRGDEPAPREVASNAVVPNTVPRLDPRTGNVVGAVEVEASIPVGSGFGGIVFTETDAWVLNSLGQTLSRIDLARNRVVATVTGVSGGDGSDLTVADGDVWIPDPDENLVVRVDGRTNEIVARIPVGLLPQGIAAGGGDVWVANHRGRPSGSISRIDPATNREVARILVGARQFRGGPSYVASAGGSVWTGVPNLDAIVRIDQATNRVVARIPVKDGGVCGQTEAGAGAIWQLSGFCGRGAAVRVDSGRRRISASILPRGWQYTFTAAFGFGAVWIGTDIGIVQLDPRTNEVLARLGIEGDVAVGAGDLWVHDAAKSSVVRLNILG